MKNMLWSQAWVRQLVAISPVYVLQVKVYSPNIVFREILLTPLAAGVLRHEQRLPCGHHAPAGRELRGVQHQQGPGVMDR